ncbi:MAG: hypothetical protein N3A38_08520, partial [Planctomycetota bacterium]|nr:hypothetical protein [Planctomycetota bacterium]
SRLGAILAVAGSAIGLGNFLRFPAQAAQNGGGAFMVPYFICLLLLGIPLMWIEWGMGRYAGSRGFGSAPGILAAMRRPGSRLRYLGVLGLVCPFIVLCYYTYIESWLLGYAWFSLWGTCEKAAESKALGDLLKSYTASGGRCFPYAYLFFVVTFLANFYFLYHGVKGGIQKLCNWAMPILFLMGIVIAVKALATGTPDPNLPANNVGAGMGYLWNPKTDLPDGSVLAGLVPFLSDTLGLSASAAGSVAGFMHSLANGKVWLAAAGQIFFTLSVGFGVIACYASYLKRDDDVALSGLTSASLNEFAEVILGGSIVIPLAFAYLGANGAQEAAQSGTFNLGFVTMPFIFHKMPGGAFFAFLWFTLLFLAGITSSVSLAQPAIAFLEDEVGLDRRKSVLAIGAFAFAFAQLAIFWLHAGAVDEMDFWAGTFGIVLFALVECVAFMWLFGTDKAWEEIHVGARMRIPRIYRYIMKYITPVLLVVILAAWFWQDGMDRLLMRTRMPDGSYKTYEHWGKVLAVRTGLVALAGLTLLLIWRYSKCAAAAGASSGGAAVADTAAGDEGTGANGG